MILLNNTGNPINREERNKINQNWQSIISGLTSLQRQINILAGGEEVDDLLNAIIDATNNANTTVDEMRTIIDEAESQLQTIIAVVDRAEQLNDETTLLVAQLTTLQTDLNGLKVILEDIASDEANRKVNEIVREDNESVRISAESSRVSAEDIRITNETNRQLAYADMMDLLNNFESVDYDPTETYDFPTLVSLNGSTYIVLQLVQGITPTDDKVNYRLVAQRGVDGTGAVASVNGVLPDLNGDVQIDVGGNVQTVNNISSDAKGNVYLTTSDIGAASQSDLDTTNNNLTTLEQEVTSHLAQNASLTQSGHVQLSSATDSDDETKAATPKAVKLAYDRAEQAFQVGNNVKASMVATLLALDGTLPISVESGWGDIESVLGNISIGGGAVYGTLQASLDTVSIPTQTGSGRAVRYVNFDFTQLDFVPEVVVFLLANRGAVSNHYIWFNFNYYESGNSYANSTFDGTYAYRVPYANEVVKIPVFAAGSIPFNYDFIAFKGVEGDA